MKKARPMTRTARLGLPLLCVATAAALAAACRNQGADAGECKAGLLPGDLVISEIMANPPGTDDGQEWFEIYNAGSDAVTLDGVLLVSAKEDGTGEKEHELGSATIEPGDYLVVGNMIDDVRPAHVDYGYGDDLGDMRNSAGKLSIRCGTETIDDALYADPGDGVARGFDGGQSPDAFANDDLGNWCDATSEYATDAFGSPGAANEPCATGGGSTCMDGEQSRDVVAPAVGDVIITEFMPNPSAVGDTDGEWFELYAAGDFDLNGLELGRVAGEVDDTISATECLSVSAGDYVVLARNPDAATNGNLPQVDFEFGFSIPNSSGSLFIGRGGELLDEVTYTGSNDGASTSLHPDRFDPVENDDEGSWCVAVDAYGDGDLGTPGADNVACDIPPPPGQCEEDGDLRDVVAPTVGDLVFTELMPDPSAVSDAEGEWFEIYVANTVDLNGLEIGKTVGDPDLEINPTQCQTVTAGTYLLFAHGDDPNLNGTLPAVDYTFDFSLTNAGGTLYVGHDAATLDEITYPGASAGAAISLDAGQLDPTANDDQDNWCDAVDVYGAGDLGTPAAANPACGGGGSGMCNDGNADRPVVKPQVGDLIITEFMPNPDAVADAAGEYLELWATKTVDLNGLQMGALFPNVKGTINSADCISIQQDSFALIVAAEAPNGGLPAHHALFPGSFALTNTPAEGGVFIGIDDALLDAVDYGSSFTGGAWNLDPDSFDASANDDVQTNWCEATGTYGDGDNGTPKGSNDQCN